MSWSRNEVTLLIEQYRKWPNLYNVKSVNYKNRNLRKAALEAIEQSLREIKPDVKTIDIQSKFQSLKQNAIKEYKKWQASYKSGAGEEEVYQPSLWYFELISFIFEHSVPRIAKDTLEIPGDNEELQESEQIDAEEEDSQVSVVVYDANIDEQLNESTWEEVASGIASSDGIISPEPGIHTPLAQPLERDQEPSTSSQYKKKKRRTDDTQYLQVVTDCFKDITNKLDVPSKTPIESFGEYVVGKLKRINIEEIRDAVEEEIVLPLNRGLKRCKQEI